MSPVLLTLLSIIVVFIGIAIWAFHENREGWQIISIVVPIVIVVFGFGLFGNVSSWEYKVEACKVHEVLKGRHVAVISTDHGTEIFEKYNIEDISDSTQFYWRVGYNHYGYENYRKLMYK